MGTSILGPEIPENWATIVRSRVLKDIFHVFHMIYISRTHGLRLAFIHAFRDACLIPHPIDKARIEVYLATRNLTWADMLCYKPKWLWRHCRRTVPPPEELYPLVHRVFMLYGPLKDAKTGLPLFNAAAWKIAKNILELVRNGYVSDVPGVALYILLGFDAKAGGLPIYRCIRSTNMVEGGVHTHLRAKLPSRGASVRHMVACLLDFVLRHNLTVGHFNSTGQKYAGHDSIWLSNKIQELEITLGEHYQVAPTALPWVNSNLYRHFEQTVGIVRIPQSVCAMVDIHPFRESHDSKQKNHIPQKCMGLGSLSFLSILFQKCHTSISTEATVEWNRLAAENEDIYYKLEEQLTSYFNGSYKDAANIRISCARVQEQTSPLQKDLENPRRADRIINAPVSRLVPLRVTSGFVEDETSHAPTLSESSYVLQHALTNDIDESTARQTVRTSSKRAAEDAAQGQPSAKKARSERTCITCGSNAGCPGRASWPATGSVYRVLLDGCKGWGYTAYVLPPYSRPSLAPVPAHDRLHAPPHACTLLLLQRRRMRAPVGAVFAASTSARAWSSAPPSLRSLSARAHARTVAEIATACTRTGAGVNAGCRDNTTERARAAAE
ncbi:hypothetical protein B0H17DRAFT_1331730 [Mycena rosella]|uniref:Uncharacterized protein n=1 Tax=Mycena rosella TaxID=1033263 RepID=A0AAD7DE89_MYCRO|nr:hypothetical protein B0H17DRAFT_1331730 [Mycena rosella]